MAPQPPDPAPADALTEIGTAGVVHASFGFRLRTRRTTGWTALDGGSLMDVGCYCVNGSRLSRRTSRVFARAGRACHGPTSA